MLLKDIRLILHEPKNLILLAVLIVMVIVGGFFGEAPQIGSKVSIGVADLDDSEYSRLLLTYFEDNDIFTSYITIIKGSESELEAMFENSEIDLYLVIPENFTEKMIRIENTPIKAVINSSDRTKAVVYRNLLGAYAEYISSVEACCQTLYDLMREEGYSRDYVDSVNVSISYELIFTALGKDDLFSKTDVRRIEGISLVNYYVYSVLSILIMYMGLAAGLNLLKERLLNVRSRLISIGVSKTRQIVSKNLAYGLVSSLVASLAMIAMNSLGELSFGFGAYLFIIASCFVSCFVFLLIGSLAGSVGGYFYFCNSLILLLVICGGGIIPIMYLPDAMAKVAGFTPNYWFIRFLM